LLLQAEIERILLFGAFAGYGQQSFRLGDDQKMTVVQQDGKICQHGIAPDWKGWQL